MEACEEALGTDRRHSSSGRRGSSAVSACRGEDVNGAAIALSVCICTANRAEDLAFALKSLARLHIAQVESVEFIIVDNASTDATPSILSAAAKDFPFHLQVLHEPTRGLASARNCALRHARGDVIAWTDDDCVPAEDWVERILANFDADPSLDILTGRVELYDPSHYPITINTSLEPVILDQLRACQGAFVVLGCNFAFRRRVLERIGVFDPRFGAGAPLRATEDTDFAFRAMRKGCHVAYTPDVLLYHNHKRVTPDQVMRLRRNYKHGDGALLMKHAVAGDRMAARWFYWRLRSVILGVLRPPHELPSRSIHFALMLEFLRGAFAYLALHGRPASASVRDAPRLGSAP